MHIAEARLKPIKYCCLSRQPLLPSKGQLLISSWLEQRGFHQQFVQSRFPQETQNLAKILPQAGSPNHPSTLQSPKLCWEAHALGRPAGGEFPDFPFSLSLSFSYVSEQYWAVLTCFLVLIFLPFSYVFRLLDHKLLNHGTIFNSFLF